MQQNFALQLPGWLGWDLSVDRWEPIDDIQMTVETLVHLIDGLQAVKYVWSVWIFNFPRVQMEHKNRHNKKHKDND